MTHADYQMAGRWRVDAAHGYAELLPARPGAIYSATGRALTRWATAGEEEAKRALIADAKSVDVLASHILGTREK